MQSSHGESPAPSLEEKVEEPKPEPPKLMIEDKPAVKVIEDKAAKEAVQAAVAKDLMADIIDDVIRSDTTEPSIPSVVLDTVNEVITEEVEPEEEEKVLPPPPPPPPPPHINEIETQESSMDITDETEESENLDSLRARSKKPKEFTINGQTVPERGALVLNGHVTTGHANTNHVTTEVNNREVKPTRTRQEPKTLELQLPKTDEKPAPHSPTKVRQSAVSEEKKVQVPPSPQERRESNKYRKETDNRKQENTTGTIDKKVRTQV